MHSWFLETGDTAPALSGRVSEPTFEVEKSIEA